MKKILVVLSMGLFAIGCGGGDVKDKQDAAMEDKKDAAEDAAPAEAPKNEDYEKGLSLVAQSDCLTCHKVNEKLVGPAYQDVANRYQATEPVIDSLANKIIKGGAGNWGQVPMTAHPQVSKEDAKTMVKYVLSLKKS